MGTRQQVLVIAESHFGNTVAVADAVAATLRAAGVRTSLALAHEASTTVPAETTALVLVAPTHDGDLSTPDSRRRAAGIGAKDSTDGRGIREWVTSCEGSRGARLICIGTAAQGHTSTERGPAASAAAELASKRGFRHVEEGPSFGVLGVAGPLVPGELVRAREWASELAEQLTSKVALASAVKTRTAASPPPGDDDLTGLSAVELARRVAAGEVSAEELVVRCIDRLGAREDLNVLAFERFDTALAEARSPLSGPLAGVPVMVKDLGCDIAGTAGSMGSALLKSARLVAGEDAAIVRRIKDAGLIVIGTTTSPEFGISSSTESVAFGRTRNPWGRERSAGGSSGGSAAAVAADVVPLAHGSDGAGSLRMPAALCGVSALKPSHGRISQAPDWEVMMGHNDNGAVARHVVDLAAFLDATDGSAPGDPAAHRADGPGSHVDAVTALDTGRPLRVGLFTSHEVGGVAIDAAVRDAVVEAGRLLGAAGHMVEEAWPSAYAEDELLDHFIDAIAPTLVDLVSGLGQALGRTIDPTAELEPITQYWFERGSRRTAGQLAGDLRWLGGFRRRLCRWWTDGWDILVAPSFPLAVRPLGLPEDGGRLTRSNIDLVRATVPFNTSGQPAVTVPALLTGDGPVGVQLVGAPGHDRQVLVAAAQLQSLNHSWRWSPPRS